jgi:atypical dual specificity phosphatase
VKNAVYELNNAGIVGPNSHLLREMTFAIRGGAITALLGPGGTGKSTLLRALAGGPLPEGFALEGRWSYSGGGIPGPGDAEGARIAWVPQKGRSDTPPCGASVFPDVHRAAATSPSVLLVDEVSAPPGAERDALASLLKQQSANGTAVVLVTHDLAFAREVADDVVLLSARRVRAAGPLAALVENPPTELVARYFRDGSAWPAPALPPHFRWIEEARLAGMGRPGLLGPIEDDLAGIASAGVSLIVTLTEDALPGALLRPHALSTRHFPIPDMGVPSVGACASVCREIERAIEGGEGVAVHCHAGLGRTGTVLAAFLTWWRLPAAEAIDRVRSVRSGYLQTQSQVDFVHRFAETHGAQPSRR